MNFFDTLNNYFRDIINHNIYFVLVALIIISLTFLLSKYFFSTLLKNLLRKTKSKYDDLLIDKGFLKNFSFYPPLVILYLLLQMKFGSVDLINRLYNASFIIISTRLTISLVEILNSIYSSSKFSGQVNIRSYVQVLKLFVYLLAAILVVSIFLNQSPLYLLSSIGALTAVIMLIFKDTILSFVSSIQITSNDLFRLGDWVEAPQFGADGDVIDIALHTIKIQNWDKTISIIPTHKLVDSSFKNWRGMTNSGGRRIKRALNIDLNSVKFCDSNMVKKFLKISLLKDYLEAKINEINQYNNQQKISDSLINGRSLTNLGIFRIYIQKYLNKNININKDLTFLVRQLAPNKYGIPIEIYVFSSDTNWIKYEQIQADIFDHLIASIKEFDLNLFQNPTGQDLNKYHENNN
ncbi:MAG: mechanosensitive ion channel protein MscS [Candidatus Marinimicrobia bacterium]|nr:mechanosensitive ion channel protein MscS [Candidatus Neomarinimicrobiota bacterium]